MPNPRAFDLLSTYAFWLADISPSFQGGRAAVPYWALNPVMGFASVGTPAFAARSETVKSGTDLYQHTVVTGHEVDRITATRGASWWAADMYRWFLRAQHGFGAPRRDLALIHFTGSGLGTGGGDYSESAISLGLGIGGLAASTAAFGLADPRVLGAIAGYWASAGLAAAFGPTIFRIPGRVWVLGDCIPTRYKPGSDFDAKSGEVSIAELEFAPSYVNELSLTA